MAFENLTQGMQQFPGQVLGAVSEAQRNENQRRSIAVQGLQSLLQSLIQGAGIMQQGEALGQEQERIGLQEQGLGLDKQRLEKVEIPREEREGKQFEATLTADEEKWMDQMMLEWEKLGMAKEEQIQQFGMMARQKGWEDAKIELVQDRFQHEKNVGRTERGMKREGMEEAARHNKAMEAIYGAREARQGQSAGAFKFTQEQIRFYQTMANKGIEGIVDDEILSAMFSQLPKELRQEYLENPKKIGEDYARAWQKIQREILSKDFPDAASELAAMKEAANRLLPRPTVAAPTEESEEKEAFRGIWEGITDPNKPPFDEWYASRNRGG